MRQRKLKEKKNQEELEKQNPQLLLLSVVPLESKAFGTPERGKKSFFRPSAAPQETMLYHR